jgi:hypothetical protein
VNTGTSSSSYPDMLLVKLMMMKKVGAISEGFNRATTIPADITHILVLPETTG